jgi:hypothetical protein
LLIIEMGWSSFLFFILLFFSVKICRLVLMYASKENNKLGNGYLLGCTVVSHDVLDY